jgi:hypothetical protein
MESRATGDQRDQNDRDELHIEPPLFHELSYLCRPARTPELIERREPFA